MSPCRCSVHRRIWPRRTCAVIRRSWWRRRRVSVGSSARCWAKRRQAPSAAAPSRRRRRSSPRHCCGPWSAWSGSPGPHHRGAARLGSRCVSTAPPPPRSRSSGTAPLPVRFSVRGAKPDLERDASGRTARQLASALGEEELLIVIALASPSKPAAGDPPKPAAGDEPAQKPALPGSHDDSGGRQAARGGAPEPPLSPPPASSNRASVKRYVEGIEPSSWLRRFGEVEIREAALKRRPIRRPPEHPLVRKDRKA